MEMGLKPTTEIPCPPLQVLPVNTMFVPLLMARQSSTYLKMDQHAQRCGVQIVYTLVLHSARGDGDIMC